MKIFLIALTYILFGIIYSSAHPYGEYRPRRSYPHQAMMFSGFYGKPSYVPQGSMTAFATRDTVATNSFAGKEYPTWPNMAVPIDEASEDESQVQTRPEPKPEITETEQSDAEEEEDLEYTTTVKPKRVTPKRKHKPTKPQPAEDEEEEDSNSWPFQGGRNGVPAYNAFFPIVFGGRGASTRSGGDSGEGYPGAATAIANSFSTGKGGVASSHAVAYGDPYLSTLLRNGGGNFKRRNLSKNEHH